MLPSDVLEAARGSGVTLASATPGNIAAAAGWLLSERAGWQAPARRYVFFLKWMYETFYAVAECFPRENRGGQEGKDAIAQGTSPEELIHIANQLYLLASHEVPGAVLECGCFKGFSAACLSHACAFLGRELIVADSFQGLPSPQGEGNGFYSQGDFRGTQAEVEENIRIYGRPEHVRYREGWFRESLRGWSRPLVLLWMDVDLYQSASDVLENVLPALDRRGAIVSHEFLPEHVKDGQIVHEGEPPGALRDIVGKRGLRYEAAHLTGHTGIVTFPATAGAGADAGALLAALLPDLRDADHRARAAEEAIGLKAGFRDLARRTRERLKRSPA
jgi:macrocin-O-methyltransferase TylF-like protien